MIEWMNEWEGIEIKIKKILFSCSVFEYNKMFYIVVWYFYIKYLIIYVLSERK